MKAAIGFVHKISGFCFAFRSCFPSGCVVFAMPSVCNLVADISIVFAMALLAFERGNRRPSGAQLSPCKS